MSRFMEFARCCTDQGALKCCRISENNEANLNNFCHNVRTQINIHDSPLIDERSVCLNEKNQTTLKIGCDPLLTFTVAARIESKAESKTRISVKLTTDELTDIMAFLSNSFDVNNTWRLQCETPSSDTKFFVDLKQTEPRTFGLRIGRKYLTIDEDTLNAMLQKKTYIEHYISLLEKKQKSYELMLFNLVNHFCYLKSLTFATDLTRSKYYVQNYFDEILNFHGDCIEKTFAIEIGANCAKWFSKCVPIFIKTMMLNEAHRLESFSSREWPHDKKYINVKKFAKSGLYFTGERDVVGCAFCYVQLHEWTSDDDPILDHHKYSPMCPFLNDSKRSLNVPIGDGKKIEQLLSTLPKIKVFDEPDI